jgi:small GTP-binding protein
MLRFVLEVNIVGNRITKTVNIMFVGDENVGKTDIWHKLADPKYEMVYQRKTIGVDSLSRNNENDIKWHIWDSAGRELTFSIISKYYSNNDIILVCYDLSNKEGLANLSKYLNTAKEKAPKAQIILVGNKSDLEQVVADEDITNFMKENNITHHVKVSVKNNNIKDLEDKIQEISTKILQEKSDAISENNITPLIGKEKKVKFRKSTILSFGVGAAGLFGGLAGFGLTAAALATTIVLFIKEAKDWLIEKSDLFKPFFDFLSQHPWLAPVVNTVAAFASSIIALIGAAVPAITGVHSHQEFNKKADNKLRQSTSVLTKVTSYVETTRKNDANDKVQGIE